MSEQDTLKKCAEVFPGLDDKKEDFGLDQLRRIAFKTGNDDKPPSGPAVQDLLNDFKIEGASGWTNIALAARGCVDLAAKEREAELDRTIVKTVLDKVDSSMADSILKKGPSKYASVMELSGEPTYDNHRNVRPGEWRAPNLTTREWRVKTALEKVPNIDVELVGDFNLGDGNFTTGKPKFHIGIRPKQK